MTNRTNAFVAAALALMVVLPGAQAGLLTVLEDSRGDVEWRVAYYSGAMPEVAEPLRDAVFERNGTEVDLEALRVGENATHIFVEVDLVDLPPEPGDCGPPAFARCGYVYDIRWTFFAAEESVSGQVKVSWFLTCRPGRCMDVVSTSIYCCMGDNPGPGGIFERVAPDVGRWNIPKWAFIPTDAVTNATVDPDDCSSGCPELARLCRGDAFYNFRFYAAGTDRSQGVPNTYVDRSDTADTAVYTIQQDSPSCPRTATQASNVPTEGAGQASWPALIVAVATAFCAAAWWVAKRRGGGKRRG